MHPLDEKEDLITRLSYLRLANIDRGLLISFHSYRLADGIKRLSLRRN